jgi:SAM-dependent methyltransferase
MASIVRHGIPIQRFGQVKLRQIAFGLACYLPGVHGLLAKNAGGGESARYCYSVWMRHLVLVHGCGAGGVPRVVAELGPGDSLGTGLAALLCGAQKYYGLDIVPHGDLESNLDILDELVGLFKAREDIPGEDEFPGVKPYLDSYRFPSWILTDEVLDGALTPGRLRLVRDSIRNTANPDSLIRYAVPWTDKENVEAGAVDMVYSQAVLEHVDDLAGVYDAMASWLKPGGVMSHEIDFTAHQFDPRWNGHWSWSDFSLWLLRGGRPYLINRRPLSEHLGLIERMGFDVRLVRDVRKPSAIPREQLAGRFRGMNEDDMTTAAGYVVATR